MKQLVRSVVLIAVLIAAGKLLEQRGKPAHGRLLGMPYDLRVPTIDRVRKCYWNPADRHILTPTLLGWGYGVNLGAVLRKVGLL